MDEETESRLTAIETKLAYIEDFVSQLQAEAVEQGKTIELLREENRILAGRFRELHDSLQEIPNRRPPHY